MSSPSLDSSINIISGFGAGGAPEGSIERQDYDKLRASLDGGNLAARLYAKWLTAFLDGVERFFGDAGMADRTLFPRAFGLKKPAPLWTAPAFDRCLLLALIYPIATIFVIWAISGHVGPAETALGLKRGFSGWSRSFMAVAVGLEGFASWCFWAYEWNLVWLTIAIVLGIAVGSALAVVSALTIFVAITVSAGDASAVALAFAVTFIVFFSFAYSVVDAGAFAVVGGVFALMLLVFFVGLVAFVLANEVELFIVDFFRRLRALS